MPIRAPKSQDYWDGFADGQRDIESQLENEDQLLTPIKLLHQLELFQRWIDAQVKHNGSEEVDEECRPIFRSHSPDTLEAMQIAGETARLATIAIGSTLLLHQGELSELHYQLKLSECEGIE